MGARCHLRPLQHHRVESVAPMHSGQRAQRPVPHRRACQPSGRVQLQHPSLGQPAISGPTAARRSPASRATASTTCSFSSASSEQVEYTSRPPGARRRAAPPRIARCRAACRARSSTRRRCRISGLRASVPVPLHGTSHRIRSNFAFALRLLRGRCIQHRALHPLRVRHSAAVAHSICASRFALPSVASISASRQPLPPTSASSHLERRNNPKPAPCPATPGIATAASSATSRDPSSIRGTSSPRPSPRCTPPPEDRSAPGSRCPHSQIANAASRPYAAIQRSTNHAGCPSRSANAPATRLTGCPASQTSNAVDAAVSLPQHRVHHPRRMRLHPPPGTSPRLRQRRMGRILSICSNWNAPIRNASATGSASRCSGRCQQPRAP